MRLQRSDQNPDLAKPLPPASDRRVQKGNIFGSIGIISLLGVLALIAGLFVIADDGFFQRDRLVLKAAIERIAPDRPLAKSDMAGVNATAGLESLRMGAAATRSLSEYHLPLDNASGQALIWRRSHSFVSLTAIGMSLVVIAMVAFFGIARVARFQATSLRSVVDEIEGRAMDMAMRDPLTGLFNRSAFRRRLENAVAKRAGKELIGVLYVDLDRFKEVNDGFGHHAGDTLLSRVTDRLRELSGPDVTIARLGGDEFALIIERQAEEADIEAFGQSISRALGEPFDIGEAEVSIGGSVGLAVAPVDAFETGELVRRADIAMYRVKESGRGTCLRFDESMEDDAKKRKSLESDLRKALDRGELHLNYQPYFASDGETMVGVEALVRWKHPEQGLISPAVFVPIAEDSGLIHQLSDFVMQTAMRQAMEWPDLTLALNLSPVQFRRKETVGTLLGFVEEIGIDPKRIEIEITEGVLVEDTETAVRVLKQFHDAGMHIALDDFGTGYSSLSYLRRFPFDKLKIDQSFVRNLGGGPGSAAIIHAVVSLGRALGLIVHAEGVETLEHHIFLRASGCHHMQGFYFARPMPAEEITKIATKQIGMIRPYPRMWA